MLCNWNSSYLGKPEFTSNLHGSYIERWSCAVCVQLGIKWTRILNNRE
jgi:hypothetical protein